MKPLTVAPRGFSLVEVMLALAIASVCLVSLLALLPAGLSGNKETVRKTVASGFAAEVVADLRNASAGNADISPRFRFEIPNVGGPNTMIGGVPQTIYLEEDGTATLVGGLSVNTFAHTSQYRVTVGFRPPADANRYEATMVRILVTWPALADPVPAAWPSRYTGSYEIITALEGD
jgi:prepilin-type N-terminal cleavage/methylation domain-containing protein